MPYKDKAKQAEYQKQRVKIRRQEWFAEHGPCKQCGSWLNLELHHRDRTNKREHRIWSWSQTRFEDETAKCDALCRKCHQALHAVERRKEHGINAYKKRGCRCEICRAWKAASGAHNARNRRKITEGA